MDTKILYNFTIYFRYPNLFGACELFRGQTTAGPRWDKSISVFATTAAEAMEMIPEGFEDMEVVKVEYPGGWPNFPLFPVSTTPMGSVSMDSMTGELKLRAV